MKAKVMDTPYLNRPRHGGFAGVGPDPDKKDWFFIHRNMISMPDYIEGTAKGTLVEVASVQISKNFMLTSDKRLLEK